jgi:hypothetical protein
MGKVEVVQRELRGLLRNAQEACDDLEVRGLLQDPLRRLDFRRIDCQSLRATVVGELRAGPNTGTGVVELLREHALSEEHRSLGGDVKRCDVAHERKGFLSPQGVVESQPFKKQPNHLSDKNVSSPSGGH